MSTPYVGEIRLFGFGRVPTGWFACDGSSQSIAEYEVLFQLIGTTYGGDGITTFNVPDLRGRVPLHNGTGYGLTTRVLGQRAGSEAVTLLTSQIPAHSHPFAATTLQATDVTPATGNQLAALTDDTMYVTSLVGANSATTSSNSTAPTGDSLPHSNLMPTLTVQYCIAWAGVFPSPG